MLLPWTYHRKQHRRQQKQIIPQKSSEKVANFLEKNSLHKRDFAEMIGVTQTAVYKWEKSDVKFNDVAKEKVIKGLNLKNVDYILSSYNIKY